MCYYGETVDPNSKKNTQFIKYEDNGNNNNIVQCNLWPMFMFHS